MEEEVSYPVGINRTSLEASGESGVTLSKLIQRNVALMEDQFHYLKQKGYLIDFKVESSESELLISDKFGQMNEQLPSIDVTLHLNPTKVSTPNTGQEVDKKEPEASGVASNEHFTQQKTPVEINRDEYTLFPNPSENGIITLESFLNEGTEITVYDAIGKIVLEEKLPPNSRKQLQLPSAYTSMYFVRFRSDSGLEKVKKLVIKK
ncbi:T9SS type A sorting domain-containing protein [Limibacter armeniacum]|uniref:T9SS type A sorting domain-containing protein n=1 Tax=Limibacter armeniacum TaxID=466084 RepID=UPI002FE5EB81